MIQQNFPDAPIVMAVGDGLNDALMIEQADVGVEVVNRDVIDIDHFFINSNTGDV